MITRALLSWLLSHSILTEANNWVIKDKVSLEVHETITFGYDNDDDNDSDNEYTYQLEKPPTTIALKSPKKIKRQLSDTDAATWRIVTKKQPEVHYDYDQFKSEYDNYIEILKEERAKLDETEFQIIPKSTCKADRFYNKGPLTVICLLDEYRHGATKRMQKEAGVALTKILTLWSILLAVFLICGWGHYGYCNDCCPLSMCFPEDNYEEIKQYLVFNPPGTMLQKMTPKENDNSKTIAKNIVYKPTEMEYYLYNKLWNKIYHD